MPSSDHNLSTRTTTYLLDALRDRGNEPVWLHIDARYRPIIRGLAHRFGLGATDADDVAQQTLGEFVRAFREDRYDRSKGRLSSWILGIAHNLLLKAMRSRRVRQGQESLVDLPDHASLREVWDTERDREILLRAIDMLRDSSGCDARTLRAFELSALRGVPAAEAAAQCGMSVEQVYVVKSRMIQRLRKMVEAMTAAFEEDV